VTSIRHGHWIAWSVNGTQQKTWTLDSLGNNLAAGTYNTANEETPTQGSSGYDAAGNMTTLQDGNTAVYDPWNRQTEVNDGEDIIQRNEYDGTNRRIRIYTDFTGSTPATTDDVYHRGQQEVETRRNGVLKYQTIWSPRYIDAPILRLAFVNGVYDNWIWYLSDANHNVTGLLTWDPNTHIWSVSERYTYTPYGVVTYRLGNWSVTSSSANANTILYTGRTLDLATNLYYYRARFYDAVLERFVGRDPIGYSARSPSLYLYSYANPIAYIDPSGMIVLDKPPSGDILFQDEQIAAIALGLGGGGQASRMAASELIRQINAVAAMKYEGKTCFTMEAKYVQGHASPQTAAELTVVEFAKGASRDQCHVSVYMGHTGGDDARAVDAFKSAVQDVVALDAESATRPLLAVYGCSPGLYNSTLGAFALRGADASKESSTAQQDIANLAYALVAEMRPQLKGLCESCCKKGKQAVVTFWFGEKRSVSPALARVVDDLKKMSHDRSYIQFANWSNLGNQLEVRSPTLDSLIKGIEKQKGL
jgi:RHS repeat-associated protein